MRGKGLFGALAAILSAAFMQSARRPPGLSRYLGALSCSTYSRGLVTGVMAATPGVGILRKIGAKRPQNHLAQDFLQKEEREKEKNQKKKRKKKDIYYYPYRVRMYNILNRLE